jgi:restriction system protein
MSSCFRTLLPHDLRYGNTAFLSNDMSRRKESFGELLLKSPWWVSVVLGLFAFAGLRWGLRAWWGDNKVFQPFETVAANFAPFVALIFGMMAGLSFWLGKRRERLVDQQTSLESLRAVSWKDFEFLVAEAYRRQGYEVDFSLGKGADGGVDLVLHKAGHTSLVQCKQWKVFSVGVPVVREMFGIMTAEQADEVIIVTSGKFTTEAENFARGKSIQLLDGSRLLELVKQVQSRVPTSNNLTSTTTESNETPFCPVCGKVMVTRTARRGQNAGNKFWGCPDYPGCKGTRQV